MSAQRKIRYGAIYLYGRGMLSAGFYSASLLLFAASLLLPGKPPGVSGLTLAALLFVTAEFLERTRAMCTIIRRFGDTSTDEKLIENVLLKSCLWSRAVWLTDTKLSEIPLRLYSPLALLTAAAVALWSIWFLLLDVPLETAVPAIVAALIAGHFLLRALAGCGARGAFGIFLLCVAIELVSQTQALATFGTVRVASGLGFLGCIYLAMRRVIHRLLPSGIIRNRFDLRWLGAELWMPVWPASRYSRPVATVSRIRVIDADELWKGAVMRFITRSRFVIAYAERLRPDSALAWEIRKADAAGCRLLLLCSDGAKPRVTDVLQRIVPKALVLPPHIDEPDRIRQWLEQQRKGWIQILSYADAAELRERSFKVLDGFFRLSAREWITLELEARGSAARMQPFTPPEKNNFRAWVHALLGFLLGSWSLETTMQSVFGLWLRWGLPQHRPDGDDDVA